ncbi:MAG: hypothetical protein ABSD67_09625 [Terracidiphilus sp.]|jgi:hypothetical protein
MDLSAFLLAADAERANLTMARLLRNDIAQLVLTGGLAIELHLLGRGLAVPPRPFNDIDFLTDTFEAIPKGLAGTMIFRHVHPHAPPGKTLLQAVDPETAVRVDVFRACGNSIARAISIAVDDSDLRMISVEDLTARIARLCMDLAHETPMPAKHARDFLRLLPLVEIDVMGPVWFEHRKPNHPLSFSETAILLTSLIDLRKDLQTIPEYSHDADERCSRCEATAAFPLADARCILPLLGYC